MELVEHSSLAIIVITLIFHLAGAVYCIKKKSTKAVFSNSNVILVSAILFNFIEISASIFLAECITVWKCSLSSKLYLAILLIFASNSFYMANLLRVHRLLILSSLESGNFSLGSLNRMRSKLDDLWYILMMIGGTFILSCPYSSYLIYRYQSNPSVLVNIRVYEVFVGSTVSAECVLFVAFLVPLFFKPVPMILKVELSFQVFAWSCALYVMRNPTTQRLFYLVPIRNSIMMLLVIMAVYEINKNFKPPLPPDIDLEVVLENEEFYMAFQDFLIRKDLNEAAEILKILLKIRIFKESFKNVDEQLVVNAVVEAKNIGCVLRDSLVESVAKGDGFCEVEVFCMNKLQDGPFKLFKISKEFVDTFCEYN